MVVFSMFAIAPVASEGLPKFLISVPSGLSSMHSDRDFQVEKYVSSPLRPVLMKVGYISLDSQLLKTNSMQMQGTIIKPDFGIPFCLKK